MIPLKGRRSEGVSDRCEYSTCREPSAGELRAHNLSARGGVPWGMCVTHVKPEYHPPDLRKRLVRW